jgi:predicted transcriptional regulator
MMLDKKVKEIMTTDVIITPSNVDVVNAFEELMEHKISAMPVVDDGELVGIITATDLGHNLILDKYELGTDVKSIMIKDVVNVILLSIIVILTFYYYCVLFFKKININWPGRIIIIVFFLIIIINFKNMLDWFHYFFHL